MKNKKFEIIDENIELQPHQIKAIEFITSRKNSCINYETGQGKTLISLESMFRLFANDEIEKALVVCTKSSILSFEEDILKTDYNPKNLVIIKSVKDLEELNKLDKQIFIIQYETLLSISLIDLMRAFKAFKSGLFIDEVHRVKTAGSFTKGGKSKQSLTAISLNKLKTSFIYLVGLTATTITSELIDGYRVLNFISPGTLGGLKWFQKNFCVYEEASRYVPKLRKYLTYHKLLRYKNLDGFLKYTKNIMIQYFPKLNYKFHVLSKSLEPGSKRALKYEELAALTHGRNNNMHSSIMPRLHRLVDKSPAKRFLLNKLIDRHRNDGLIVYTRTRKGDMIEYIQQILEAKDLEVKVISGSTKKDKRKEIKNWAFEGSPSNKALIITDAAGQSMNLEFTHNLIFWEIPMGIGKFLQLKGRIGRMSSKWPQFDFYFLLIKNTIDEYFYLKFTSNKEMMKFTGSDIAIPQSKMNMFDERKLKRERDSKMWCKENNNENRIKKNIRRLK